MARHIGLEPAAHPLSLGDAIAALDASAFDPRDEEAFVAVAPILQRLAANRTFLADLAIAEIEVRCAGQRGLNRYGAQVIVLHRSHARYFIRANMWPAAGDAVVKASGIAPFFYDIPHDHNFSFLTVGYLGSGYWSDYFEYDYAAVEGWIGEPVTLHATGRRRLEEGQVMLYRAHRDVHRQLPADSFSVSLNIMEDTTGLTWRDQYRFDLERGAIAGMLSRTPSVPLLALGAAFCGEEGRALVEHVVETHPSDRIRADAFDVLVSATRTEADRLAAIERGARSASGLVRRRALAMLAAEQIVRRA